MILSMAACLGLVWHYGRRHDARNFFHSPAFGGLVALMLLAATVPLSGSRSSTLLTLVLFLGALAHWAIRAIRQRRARNESPVPAILSMVAASVVGLAGIWFVAHDTIRTRTALTQQQVETMLKEGSIGARADLYRNTWHMARDKLWFGWGMDSYPHVFSRFYNTQTSRVDRLPVFYRDAHSDWLQAFAEHGLVGSALLAWCALLPLRSLKGKQLRSPVPLYLLGGCAFVLVYAWIEFPFANVSVVLTWWLCWFSAVQYGRLQDREMPAARKR
jgi:O-antigen ligase